RRDDQLIDGCDTKIGVDEQPFPIERHDVYAQRVGFRGDRCSRIELMGPDPNNTAKQNYGQCRDRPHDELDALFIGLVRTPDGMGVGGSVPPGERQGSHDYGNHDDEHDRRRIDEDKSLRRSDRPLGIQYAGRLTGRDKNRGAYSGPAEPARTTKAAWRAGGSAHRNWNLKGDPPGSYCP